MSLSSTHIKKLNVNNEKSTNIKMIVNDEKNTNIQMIVNDEKNI